MAKITSKLIHSFRSYSPKTGVMTSLLGPIQQGARTRWAKFIILLHFDETIGMVYWIQGGQASVVGLQSAVTFFFLAVTIVGCISALRKSDDSDCI